MTLKSLKQCGCLFLPACILVLGLPFVRAAQTDQTEPNGVSADVNALTEPNEIERPDHNHPAFDQREPERKRLVERYIRREGIDDAQVLKAMEIVPRHVFVRKSDLRRAYADHPLGIGYNQTISQPYIVAFMTDALQLDPNDKVLEVGTGSGYQAAVCAEIARQVYSIEIIKQLADSSQRRLQQLGYRNVIVRHGDGHFGWEQHAPFDKVIVTCAAGFVPPALIRQMKVGGRMVVPVGSPFGVQTLKLIIKQKDGGIKSRSLLPVRFVPMVGRTGQRERAKKR